MKNSSYLAPYVRSFFEDHLSCQRNVSRNTIHSYRDGLKLFFRFAAQQLKMPAAKLLVADVTEGLTLAFLTDLEQTRANSIQTRNHRLVGIRRLFEYIAAREPLFLDHCHKIATIPRKRGALVPEIHYLEKEQVNAILQAARVDTPLGRRDYALLLFMYNSGARREARDAASLLFKVIDARVQKRSTALVTNIDFDAWGEYLGDPPLAMALLDRIVDGAIIVKIAGQSYRAHRAKPGNKNTIDNGKTI